MKQRRGLRITIVGGMVLVAVAAVIFNYFRPTSRDEAIRIATDYVKRRWPHVPLQEYDITAEPLGYDPSWHVNFKQQHVIHCIIIVQMNMNRAASLLDEDRGVLWQWAEEMKPEDLNRLRADAQRLRGTPSSQ